MITTQALSLMDDGHLIASLHADMDSLTSTPVERELLKRFEESVSERNLALVEIADDFEFDADQIDGLRKILAFANVADMCAVIDVIENADLGAATELNITEELKRRLQIAHDFEALIEDAGDIFTRLHQLAQTTQE